MNLGKTLFAKLMEFVPWSSFARIVARYSGDARVAVLPCTEHFPIMANAQLTWCESLRDIEATLGTKHRRQSLCTGLQHHRPVSVLVRLGTVSHDQGRHQVAYAARFARLYPQLHSHQRRPQLGDVNVLDILPIEAGSFYIKDRGYLDFARLCAMHQAGVFFVTRAKSNFNARRVYSAKVDKATGVACDQSVALNGQKSASDYPEHLRRVRFKDPDTGKTLVFLTNNTTLPAPVIAQLYKNRWQVELFFKWIKQHLRIKKFLGTSENAVKTQIWCAVSTYVLIAIVKKELQLDASLYTLLQILSVGVFEKTPLNKASVSYTHLTLPTSDLV